MSRALRWTLHLANLLVGATGCVYFVMKHLLTSEDPFAVVNHPLQPAVQHLHVLAGPLLTFVVGAVWAAHALPNARRAGPGKRRSGLLLMAGFPAMAASGYLLQVSAEPPWRDLWLWMHVVTGALWGLTTALHLAPPVLAAALQRRTSRTGAGPSGAGSEGATSGIVRHGVLLAAVAQGLAVWSLSSGLL